MARERPDARFLVVGDAVTAGDRRLKDELLDLRMELGLQDRVLFPGRRSDIPNVMAALDIFVLPSTMPEPWGFVTLEAMATAKPVIATKQGGPLEMITDGLTGFLVAPDSPDEMSAKMLYLLNTPDQAAQMGRAARLHCVGNFSIERSCAITTQCYETILQQRGGTRVRGETPPSVIRTEETGVTGKADTGGQMVDLAICIVTHDARANLEVCLTKLHEVMPEALSMHIVVVDNSRDGSTDYVNEAWPHVHTITNPKPLGFGANVNQAVDDIDARYLLVMNPDVVLSAGAIETMAGFMDSHPEAGACGPKTFYPDGTLQATSRRFPHWGTVFWRWLRLDRLWRPPFYRRFMMEEWDHNDCQPVDWLMASCILIRTDAFNAVRGFDTDFFMYYEDIDLCRRLWQYGYSVYFVPDAAITHKYRRHSARSLVNPLTITHLSSILHYRRKHGMSVGQFSNRNLLLRATLLLIIFDMVATQLALQVARYLRLWFPLLGAFPYPAPSPLRAIIYLIVPVIWTFLFSLLGLYTIRHVRNYRRELGRLLAGVILSGLVLTGAIYALFLYEVYIPRLLLAYFLAVDFSLLILVRAGFRYVLGRDGLFYQPRTLIVGAHNAGRRLAHAISTDTQADLNLIGTIDWPPQGFRRDRRSPRRTAQ